MNGIPVPLVTGLEVLVPSPPVSGAEADVERDVVRVSVLTAANALAGGASGRAETLRSTAEGLPTGSARAGVRSGQSEAALDSAAAVDVDRARVGAE